MQCPRCEGTGLCSECHGQGFVTCVSCDGSGQRSSSRGASYPCRNCKGTGRAACSAHCPSCEGSGEITAALQAKVRDKYETRFDNTLPRTKVTFAITFSCIFLWVLGELRPEVGAWLYLNLTNISNLWTLEPWRLLTYAFLHAGFLHLLFNLATFVRFGPLLEGLYGTRRYVLALLIAALSGGLVSALGHQQVVASLGLSGVVFGLFGLLAGGYQRYRMYDGSQVRDQIVWLVIYSGVSLAWTAGIDHWCHLGGFLGGFAYAWCSRRPSGK